MDLQQKIALTLLTPSAASCLQGCSASKKETSNVRTLDVACVSFLHTNDLPTGYGEHPCRVGSERRPYLTHGLGLIIPHAHPNHMLTPSVIQQESLSHSIAPKSVLTASISE